MDSYAVQVGVRYYYFVRAYAADGSLSHPSDTLDYELMQRPGPMYPAQNALVTGPGLYFQWADFAGGGLTVVRVKDITELPSVFVWISKRFQVYGAYPEILFDADGAATGELMSARSYQWRVDRFIPGANEGARSTWQAFRVK